MATPASSPLYVLCTILLLLAAPSAGEIQLLDGSDWTLERLSGGPPLRLTGAAVPGGVWDNMHRLGQIGDPLFRDNDVRFANVTTQPNGTVWRFTKTFQLAASAASGAATDGSQQPAAVLLELLGVQTLASVAVNGVEVLETDNMFRVFRAALPVGLLHPAPATNTLSITLRATTKADCSDPPAPAPGFCNEATFRDESDAWGWDWSPDLNPMAVYRSVRLVTITPEDPPYVASFSPTTSVVATDPDTNSPTSFLVNASLALIAAPHAAARTLTVTLRGDWGQSTAVNVSVPASTEPTVLSAHALLHAATPAIRLWFPLHYGTPALHNITATLAWADAPTGSTPTTHEKRLGFRSIALDTGPIVPSSPAHTDPAHADAYVGCFRDGNIFWGGFQQALPHAAETKSSNMSVARCLQLCRAADGNFTLAGLRQGNSCFCGTSIGTTCPHCLPGVGTLGDPSECNWPCTGSAGVACGGASYMWGSLSVYNLTGPSPRPHMSAPSPAPNPGPSEGSGNSSFAFVVNGVRVFARGANLVPFVLLEATIDRHYIRQTVLSSAAGNMNMIRVWGGGIYQDDAFYDACDEAGIMIFHDMMFSFRLYPHHTDFEASVRQEVEEQVLRLRHHPAIVLWDSSNENEGDPAFFFRVVLDTIAATDKSRPLWPASPSSGFVAGVHTATGLPNGNPLVGRFQETLDTHMPYNFCNAGFVVSTSLEPSPSLNPQQPNNPVVYFKSEFGQISLPAFETLSQVLNQSAGDFGVFSEIMVHRKHAGGEVAGPITALFGNSSAFTIRDFADVSEGNFRRAIFLSQLTQMMCIKTVLEELRRSSQTNGALMWQLNDVWQASSWGSLDYGGRWRALHHSLQAVFAPTLVSVWVEDGHTLHVYASHHGAVDAGDEANLQVQVNITHVDTGEVAVSKTVPYAPAATSDIQSLLALPLAGVDPARQVVVTQIAAQPASLTVHPLLPPAGLGWAAVPDTAVGVLVTGAYPTFAVKITNHHPQTPVFYLVVTSTFPGHFSRNLLFLPASASQTVDFVFAVTDHTDPTIEAFQDSLSFDWFNRGE